jgi:hypothetical protein
VRDTDRSEIGQRPCFVRDPDGYRVEILEM